jgi:lysine/arginine/ornithine transport system substrate-binding protein
VKKLLTMLLGSMLAVSIGAHAKEWSTIRFGVDPSYPPFESKAPDGSLVGFDIDVGNELCRRLDAKCVWVENAFDGMIPGLKSRKFDGVLSTMSMTPARVKQIAFTSKLFHVPTRLVAKRDANVQPTAEGLAGKSVGVEQGSMQETYAKAHWGAKGVTVVSYADQDQVYADLLSGRLDASLQNAVQAERGFLETPRGKPYAFAGGALEDPAIFGPGTAIGLRRENADLKAKLDGAIAAMIKDGTYKRIEKKYFDFDIYGE